MKNRNHSFAVSMGDPAGIGPETLLKACSVLPKSYLRRITVFGDLSYLDRLNCSIEAGVPLLDAEVTDEYADGLRVRPIGVFGFEQNDFGKVTAGFGEVAMRSLSFAVNAIKNKEFDALITAPICKESVNLAGYKIAGHTQWLADRFGVKVVMMLACPYLKVVVVTTHLALRDVAGRLSKEKIESAIRIINNFFKRPHGKNPDIAVCALNPHASDGGLFGDEEKTIITPAINEARKSGLRVSGPIPADSLFTQRSLRTFDVALAMYHDQGLIPVKLLGGDKTVNVTLGLPFVRVSVGHGVAFDIAGKNQASETSMVEAFRAADSILSGDF